MSAETLRQAASLMRERAEAATPNPWGLSSVLSGHIYHRGYDVAVAAPKDAEHIASWHPAVALAVADLLDGLASDEPWDFRHDEALTVARAYLGESA